ncbi:MAG: hypothetical protein WB775_12110 [Burkholderiaceae bacterium]|jgi:hypothetical protein
MSDVIPPDLAIGGLIFAAAVLYAAWHEYAARNRRDAQLLAAAGALSLMGSAAVWVL